MATIISKIRLYDAEAYRSLSYSSIETTTLNGQELSSQPLTKGLTPGNLVDVTVYDGDPETEQTAVYDYVRTDLTNEPTEIQGILGMCWNEASYTLHEAVLRG